ncbi:hypothetical protein BRC2024_QFGIOCBO_CDS_0131 [Acinetobacter phage vB_AbaM_PhT2-v2]
MVISNLITDLIIEEITMQIFYHTLMLRNLF